MTDDSAGENMAVYNEPDCSAACKTASRNGKIIVSCIINNESSITLITNLFCVFVGQKDEEFHRRMPLQTDSHWYQAEGRDRRLLKDV